MARLSAEKARVVADRVGTDRIVVAADTTVDVDGQILEKPIDDADARRMLALLSGRAHLVHTGVTVVVRLHGPRSPVTDDDRGRDGRATSSR